MKETVTDMWNSERVDASRGPEMRGSEPSALPHLTGLTLVEKGWLQSKSKLPLSKAG